MYSLPFRQIHLDFHTSEMILSVGEAFDADEFAATLERARVNSITCFSKCHHGMIYHDTKFEARHPGLKVDLLAKQIGACHAKGIKVPVYISVGLDEFMLSKHPDWIVVGADGRQGGPSPLDAGYHVLGFNNPAYLDYLVAEIDEVFSRFSVDGIFFDIIGSWGCCCRRCRASMLREGRDFLNAAERQAFSDLVTIRMKERLTAAIRAHSADAGVFFNSGHVGPHWRHERAFFSHLELESLPSGGWGYDHFPITARYARLLDPQFLGMTGKFQTTWGDFGSFKNAPALEYEAFTAMALGGRCSIGDQLHPNGQLTEATYALIGEVYAQVEAKEPWCTDVQPLVEIAIVNPEAVGRNKGRVDDSIAGAHRMLKESFFQYDVIDTECDLSLYKVIIMPDIITLSDDFAARINAYVAGGGKVIASHESGLGLDKSDFALKGTGLEYMGPYEFEKTFLKAEASVAAGIPVSEHVMYERGMKVKLSGAEVLAEQWDPYFNRTALTFCSHQHAPAKGKSEYPGATMCGGVVYFSHPIFGLYKRYGVKTYKQLVINALALLIPEGDRLVTSEAPSTAEFMLNRQAAHGRQILHAMHYVPVRRADKFDVVEEIIPLSDVKVAVRLPDMPTRVVLEPQGEELTFVWDGSKAHFRIPCLRGHQLISLEGPR